MILSVSRRTDIPCFYFDWFINRLNEGYVYVRNPINKRQVSLIDLSKDRIDCIVFWSKNPIMMMKNLDKLKDYNYYIQFTITGYGYDIEPFCEDKEIIIKRFIELSDKIGKDKIVLRYDPILISEKYDLNFHVEFFNYLISSLKYYTNIVVISFIDIYRKIKNQVKMFGIRELNENEIFFICECFSNIAKKNNVKIQTCCEKIDLSMFGIGHGSCINKEIIENIIGYELNVKKDKNQRKECGCIESVDIGCYDSCTNGCMYCYANNRNKISKKIDLYDCLSPILCDYIKSDDNIVQRELYLLKK